MARKLDDHSIVFRFSGAQVEYSAPDLPADVQGIQVSEKNSKEIAEKASILPC